MDLLLLLTSTLLSSYFHPWIVVNAEPFFVLKDVTLTIEPSVNVTRDTSVTLRCHANIISSDQEPLSREYTLYKDTETIYNKVMSTSEDFLHQVPNTRLSDSGKYKCNIRIEKKSKTSQDVKLTVTGLSKPVLHVNNSMVREGEEVLATCMAPGERGSFYFYFYEDSKEIHSINAKSNQAEASLSISSFGSHIIHCDYNVLVMPFGFKSEQSNAVKVSFTELSITVSLDISPQHGIYEGDEINITCTVINFPQRSDTPVLYLSQRNRILTAYPMTTFTHSVVIKEKDSAVFDCGLEFRKVKRVTTKKIPVIVLSLLDHGEGVFTVRAIYGDINITCLAEARGLQKRSKTLAIRPKVHVSPPRISMIGNAIIQQPITVLCQSDRGSLPINYTLLKDNEPLETISVNEPFRQARFTVTFTRTDEKDQYKCAADNTKGKNESVIGERLSALVTEPLKNLTLMVIPKVEQIFEGDHLSLICKVTGTPPITFKFYQEGNKHPLNTSISNVNYISYEVPRLSKAHSGKYFCEANNRANQVVTSDMVNIEVRMAIWKKGLIGGCCLLVLSMLVVVCVLCIKSKRGKREAPAELSVRSATL